MEQQIHPPFVPALCPAYPGPMTFPSFVRPDRLCERPSARNSQGLFPPAACLFVGNLSNQVPVGQLVHDLTTCLSGFGSCYVKIKTNRDKRLSGAFAQFERISDANGVLSYEDAIYLHGRRLRLERAKAERTAIFGYRSVASVTAADVSTFLRLGAFESCSIESIASGSGGHWTSVFKATFAFVGDYKDALNYYKDNATFYMEPAAPGPVAWPVHIPAAAPAPAEDELDTSSAVSYEPGAEPILAPISKSVCEGWTPNRVPKPVPECRSAPPTPKRALSPAPQKAPALEPTPGHPVLRCPVKKGTKLALEALEARISTKAAQWRTSDGLDIEQFVRREAKKLKLRLKEKDLREVIDEAQDIVKKKCRRELVVHKEDIVAPAEEWPSLLSSSSEHFSSSSTRVQDGSTARTSPSIASRSGAPSPSQQPSPESSGE